MAALRARMSGVAGAVGPVACRSRRRRHVAASAFVVPGASRAVWRVDAGPGRRSRVDGGAAGRGDDGSGILVPGGGGGGQAGSPRAGGGLRALRAAPSGCAGGRGPRRPHHPGHWHGGSRPSGADRDDSRGAEMCGRPARVHVAAVDCLGRTGRYPGVLGGAHRPATSAVCPQQPSVPPAARPRLLPEGARRRRPHCSHVGCGCRR